MNTNYIELATRDNDTFLAALNDRIAVNSLTGALVGRTQSYIAARAKRALESRIHDMDPDDVNNIDNFSEDDREDKEGLTVDQMLRKEQGNEVADIYRDMVILNGLRHLVYEDMYRFCEVAHPDLALYSEPKRSIGDKINYDQPMSAEKFVDFIIQKSGDINESEYDAAIKELKDAKMHSEQAATDLRLTFQEQANRKQAQMRELRAEILTEINGLPTTGIQSSEFSNLDPKLQISLVEKHVAKLQKKFKDLLPFRTPTHASNRAAILGEVSVFEALSNDLVRAARHIDA